MQISQHDVVMAYPNVLMDTDVDLHGLTQREWQPARLKEYVKRHEEKRRKHAEEMCAAREGISGTDEHDEEEELLGGNIGALRD